MSITDESEQDLELKLRFMRWLWNIGYFTRKNINLTNLDIYQSGQSYTDLDVIGIKFDESFRSYIVIGDCKSGRSIGRYERFFWLNGIMKYFNTDEAFFIRNNVIESSVSEIAHRLNITPLSLNRLKEMEMMYEINESSYYGAFSLDQNKTKAVYKLLRNKDREIDEYIRDKFWTDSFNEQILTLIACCKRIDGFLEIKERPRIFLIASILSTLSIALLGFSRKFLFVSEDQKNDYFKQSLLGGRIESYEKKKILSSFYEFMTQEIEERYHQRYPISSNAFIEGLIPPYAKYLYDLIVRLQNNPRNSIHIPRFLDYIAHQNLDEKEYHFTEIFSKQLFQDRHRLLRPVLDLLVFLERGEIIGKDLVVTLKDIIKEIEGNKT